MDKNYSNMSTEGVESFGYDPKHLTHVGTVTVAQFPSGSLDVRVKKLQGGFSMLNIGPCGNDPLAVASEYFGSARQVVSRMKNGAGADDGYGNKVVLTGELHDYKGPVLSLAEILL